MQNTQTQTKPWGDIIPPTNPGIFSEFRDQFLKYEALKDRFLFDPAESTVKLWYENLLNDFNDIINIFTIFELEKLHFLPFTIVFPEEILPVRYLMYGISFVERGTIIAEDTNEISIISDEINTPQKPYLIFMTDLTNFYGYNEDIHQTWNETPYGKRPLILQEALSIAYLQSEYFHRRFRGLQVGRTTISPASGISGQNVFLYRLGEGQNARLRVEMTNGFFFDREFPNPTTCVLFKDK